MSRNRSTAFLCTLSLIALTLTSAAGAVELPKKFSSADRGLAESVWGDVGTHAAEASPKWVSRMGLLPIGNGMYVSKANSTYARTAYELLGDIGQHELRAKMQKDLIMNMAEAAERMEKLGDSRVLTDMVRSEAMAKEKSIVTGALKAYREAAKTHLSQAQEKAAFTGMGVAIVGIPGSAFVGVKLGETAAHYFGNGASSDAKEKPVTQSETPAAIENQMESAASLGR